MVLKKSVQRYYVDNPRMVSSPFGGIEGVNRSLYLEVFNELGINPHEKNVLDVGCGRGHVGEVVEQLGGTYTGVDFVASGSGFRLALSDACELPFPDGQFDLLFCVDAFEHFPDQLRASSEFRRVLKEGGSVFLSVPNYSNVAGLVKKFCETFGSYDKDTWAPFGNWKAQELETHITSRKVRKTFNRAGFSQMKRIGYGVDVGMGLFPWIEHGKMPEAIKFRMQRLLRSLGRPIAKLWPDASLHGFWKIDV